LHTSALHSAARAAYNSLLYEWVIGKQLALAAFNGAGGHLVGEEFRITRVSLDLVNFAEVGLTGAHGSNCDSNLEMTPPIPLDVMGLPRLLVFFKEQ
jgi:hypothetical protein